MVNVQRASVLVGTVLAATVLLVAYQGLTQEVLPQTEVSEDPTYQEGAGRDTAPGEIIVKLEGPATEADLRDLNQENDASIEEDLPRSDVTVVDLPRELSVEEAVREYENSPDVAYAEPNYRLKPAVAPNDPGYGELWGLDNSGQTGGAVDADVDGPEVWNSTTGSSATVVAVIDEGIDTNHPDLRDNMWRNPGEVPNNGVDDDRNGYVDDVNGYDFANDDKTVYDPDPMTGQGDEHGTHVAGTIAAEGDNGVGITGVNWDAQVAALKFLGPNGGYTSDAVEAINYAVAEGMDISNNSWGGGGRSQALEDAIEKADAAGHLFVAAAGNGGSDGEGDDNDLTPHYPSSYGSPNVVAVAATDDADRLAYFSNYGSGSVDLAAPGVGILSTLPDKRYARYSGTSMATPHVTGMAALIKSQEPGLGDGQIKARILRYVDRKASLNGKVATDGRLNGLRAITNNADTTAPSVRSLKPERGSTTRDRTPRISATVTDNRTELRKSNIRLYLDGTRRKTFDYNAVKDRLGYVPAKLSYGKHSAKILAKDAAGNVTTRTWGFKVVR